MSLLFRQLEYFLFYALLVAIPFQLRKVVYQIDWRFVEWRSVSFYLTDIILFLVCIFWLYHISTGKEKIRITKNDFILVIFLLAVAGSIFNSSNELISLFSWLKIAEFIIFYFYLKLYALKRFGDLNAVLALLVGGFFQAIVGIAQFTVQSSIGFTWLGEGVISPNIPGVAVFYNSVGEKVMRAYGTTPHSNILAGYLLLCLFAISFAWHKFLTMKESGVSRLVVGAYGVILFGFLLTFSRTAIFAWALGMAIFIIYEFYKNSGNRSYIKRLVMVTFLVLGLFCVFYWPEVVARIFISKSEEAVELRVYFMEESVKTTQNWLGVGTGNFVSWLMDKNPGQPPWRYQPVHNLYLLVYSEVGIIGLAFLLIFLLRILASNFKRLKDNLNRNVFIYSLVIIFIALFDHYLWTLQQGHFIWWGTLALASYIHSKT